MTWQSFSRVIWHANDDRLLFYERRRSGIETSSLKGSISKILVSCVISMVYSLPVVTAASEPFNVEWGSMRHVNNKGIRKNYKLISIGKQLHDVTDFVPTEPNESGIVLWKVLLVDKDVGFKVGLPRDSIGKTRGPPSLIVCRTVTFGPNVISERKECPRIQHLD